MAGGDTAGEGEKGVMTWWGASWASCKARGVAGSMVRAICVTDRGQRVGLDHVFPLAACEGKGGSGLRWGASRMAWRVVGKRN